MMTVVEMSRLGGLARARKLSPERRRAIARKAGKVGGRAKARNRRKGVPKLSP